MSFFGGFKKIDNEDGRFIAKYENSIINASENLAQTMEEDERSLSVTFRAMANTPHIIAATTEYNTPFE
jgi:hypothetical protein